MDVTKSRNGFQSIEMELALDSLKEYSVYAFIIHDPSAHHDFHAVLQKQFENLHYSSGEHLVFFGLVDSPQKLSLVGRRPFYQDVRDMVNSYEEMNKNDASYSAFALANSLNIEAEMLPAIVVTHDTRLSSFRYYKSSAEELERQFSRLTGISYRMNGTKELPNLSLEKRQEILYDLLDKEELDLCNGKGSSELMVSMARALSDVLSFLVPDSRDYNERTVKKIATEQKKTSIDRVMKSLKHLKKDLEGVNIDEIESHNLFRTIEELNIILAVFLKLSKQNQLNIDLENLPIKKEWLDQQTWQFLITGLEVASFLNKDNPEVDYSASAICLAKMFEQEINNSFVHWVRKANQIDLPEYYNKVQPGVRALVTPNFPRKNAYTPQIDLNRDQYGSWQPPELGKSMNIAKYNIGDNDWANMGITNYKEFLREWRTIHSIRNKAAHTEVVTISDFNRMKLSLINIAKDQVLESLSNLKNSYRGVIS